MAIVEQKWWRTQVSEWFSKFKNSVTPDKTFQNSQCLPTHQTEENFDPLKTLVLENRTVTIHGVSKICRFHFGQFREIWMTLGWRERNQQDATNLMFIIKLLSHHVSGIIMPIIRRTRVCIWCSALVVMTVVVWSWDTSCVHCESYCSTLSWSSSGSFFPRSQ